MMKKIQAWALLILFLVVLALLVPQSLAYALLAGLPPATGLACAAAAALDPRSEICPRMSSPPAKVSRPASRREVLACPLVGADLEWAPDSSLVDEYLCGVYWRMPRKTDDSGDFTWKDAAAAARVGRTVCEYAIGGMHRDLREALYALGHQADEAGINWSFLSAFRDDFRQGIATGFRAQQCQSWHGGSCKTKQKLLILA